MTEGEHGMGEGHGEELTDAEVTQELFKIFGRELTGFMTHFNIDDPDKIPYGCVATVSKWARGTVMPSQEDKITLRNIFKTTTFLREVEDDDTIRNWVMGMNPHLDDQSPAKLFKSRPQDVQVAAEAFVQNA